MEMNSIKQKDIVTTIESQISVDLQNPRRVLHFSDGVLEEFSDDEDDEKTEKDENDNKQKQLQNIDESKLTWGPWLLHKATKTGNTVLAGCDYVGEGLASFLGITTPKYNCEIEEFKRAKEEDEKYRKEKEESASWQERTGLNENEVVTKDISGHKEKF